MKTAVYYIVIFIIVFTLYMTAVIAERNKKMLITKVCYAVIFLVVLLLV